MGTIKRSLSESSEAETNLETETLVDKPELDNDDDEWSLAASGKRMGSENKTRSSSPTAESFSVDNNRRHAQIPADSLTRSKISDFSARKPARRFNVVDVLLGLNSRTKPDYSGKRPAWGGRLSGPKSIPRPRASLISNSLQGVYSAK